MTAAVVLDMDGLLIDSEPFWRTAGLEVLCKVCAPLIPELTHLTIGLRTVDGVNYWYARSPWSTPSTREVAEPITQRGLTLIRANGAPLPFKSSASNVSPLPLHPASRIPYLYYCDPPTRSIRLATSSSRQQSSTSPPSSKPRRPCPPVTPHSATGCVPTTKKMITSE